MMIVVFFSLLLTPEAPYAPDYVSARSTPAYEARDPQYVDCMRLIAKDLAIGRIGAQQWAVEGGGAPAQHCLAIADLAAGFPKLAAMRLADLAERADAGDPSTRARILAQGALAWLAADAPDEAGELVTRALDLGDDLGDVHFVAAKTYAAQGRWTSALEAASAAIAHGAGSAEAWAISARARRSLGDDSRAVDDVVTALTLDPTNLDALVLRGELRQAGFEIEAYVAPLDAASSQ